MKAAATLIANGAGAVGLVTISSTLTALATIFEPFYISINSFR